MLIAKDRIKELTSTTGAGTLTLTGAEAGFQAFSVLGNTRKCYYSLTDVNGTDWEVGEGTYNSNTLTRDVVLESSNSGTAISLSATGSTVFVTYPSNYASYSNVGVNRDYLADGNIDAGKPLILNTDNSVTQVGETPSTIPAGLGTKATTLVSGTSNYDQQVAMGINGQFVSVYRQGSDFMCQVNTISTTDLKTITHGTSQLTFNLSSSTNVGIIYQPDADKYVLFYKDGSSYLTGSVMTVSGTGASATLTTATAVTLRSTAMNGSPDNNNLTYDTSSDLLIASWTEGSIPRTVSMPISGSTISANTVESVPIYGSYVVAYACRCAYSSTANKVVYLYSDSSTENLYTTVGTVSGSSFTFGSTAIVSNLPSGNNNGADACVGVDNNGVVVISYLDDVGQTLWSQSGTLSGTTITWGSPSQVSNVACPSNATNECTIGSIASGKMIIARGVNSTSPSYLNKGIFVIITSSGTTVTNGTVQEYSQTDSRYPCVSTNYSKTQAVINWGDTGLMDMNNIVYLESAQAGANETNLSNDNYFGVASTNVVSGEQVGVNRSGSFNNNQSGMTAGFDQYVTGAGLIKERTTTTTVPATTPTTKCDSIGQTDQSTSNSQPAITYEATSGKYVAYYVNNQNSSYPTIAIGTWSNGTITWGTAIVITSLVTADQAPITSGDGRIYMLMQNTGFASMQLCVGTISGNSFTETYRNTIQSSVTAGEKIAYSPTQEQVIMVYSRDNGGEKGYARTASISASGSLTALGSEVLIENTNFHTDRAALTYDPDTDRALYTSFNGAQGDDGYAWVLQASGSSASPTVVVGTGTKWAGTTNVNYTASCYDTLNNKVFIAYRTSTENKGVIATINAGTNAVTFAGINTIRTSGGDKFSVAYDVDAEKITFWYRDDDNSDYLTYKTITPSASTFTVADGTVLKTADCRLGSNSASSGGTGKGVALITSDSDTSPAGQLNYASSFYGTITTSVVNGQQFVGTARSGTDLELSEPPVELVGIANGSITKGKPVIIRTDGDFAQVTGNLTASNFLGFAQNTVSDNEDVKVAIISQTDENQSGLTTASQYYVQDDGTLSTTAGTPSVLGGTALSSTKILIKS